MVATVECQSANMPCLEFSEALMEIVEVVLAEEEVVVVLARIYVCLETFYSSLSLFARLEMTVKSINFSPRNIESFTFFPTMSSVRSLGRS